MGQDEIRSYASQWRSYRARRRAALFLLYGFVPLCLVELLLLKTVGFSFVAAVLITLFWLAAMIAAIWWAGEVRCPRCWRRFGFVQSKGFVGFWSRGLFEDTCLNCKERKFSDAS